jgi:hypothetical protein
MILEGTTTELAFGEDLATYTSCVSTAEAEADAARSALNATAVCLYHDDAGKEIKWHIFDTTKIGRHTVYI